MALSTLSAVVKATGMVKIAQEEYIECKERKSKAITLSHSIRKRG